MKTLRYLITLLLFWVTASNVNACSCAGGADFIRFLQQYHSRNGLLVIKARIIGTVHGYGTQMIVIKDYYGPLKKDTIIAWGSDGGDCRATLKAYYQPGDTIFVIAESDIMPYVPYETYDDYFVSFCANTHMQVKGDSVFSKIYADFATHGFPLDQFEDSLNNMIDTFPAPTGINDLKHKVGLSAWLYPNPASNQLNIDYSEPGTILFYAIDGRVLQTEELPKGKQHRQISINFPQGICLYRYVSATGKIESGRILINGER